MTFLLYILVGLSLSKIFRKARFHYSGFAAFRVVSTGIMVRQMLYRLHW
jgi:hypothetical protein